MQLLAKRVCLQLTTSPKDAVATRMSVLDACTRHPPAHDRFAHARMLAAMLVGSSFAAVIAPFFSSSVPTLPAGRLNAA